VKKYEDGYKTTIVQDDVPVKRLAETFQDHVLKGCDAILCFPVQGAPGTVRLKTVFNKGSWHTRFWVENADARAVKTIVNPAPEDIDMHIQGIVKTGHAKAITYSRRRWPDSSSACIQAAGTGQLMTDTYSYKPPGSFHNV
jgi:hypothetical protein